MSFADSTQPSSAQSIHLTSGEFEVIFQVTKELHSLPTAVVEDAGWGNDDIDRLLTMVRGVRARVEGVPFVQVKLEGPDAADSVPVPPAVSEVKQGEASIRVVAAVLPYRLGREWRLLAEAVLSSLGPRELFLRTGYRVDEILTAIRQLPGDIV